jgi:hypothetical protein
MRTPKCGRFFSENFTFFDRAELPDSGPPIRMRAKGTKTDFFQPNTGDFAYVLVLYLGHQYNAEPDSEGRGRF